MMKTPFFYILILFCNLSQTLQAQSPKLDSIQSKLDSIYLKRQLLNKNNMTVLGAWAGINLIQSSISAASTKGSTQAFFKMNVYWNVANAAIAGIGFIQAKKALARTITPLQNWQQQQKTEQFLLFNTGLDAAYITTGMYLREHGLRVNNLQTQGYGSSIILQGSFLLVLDIIQYFEHRHNGKRLSNIALATTNNGFGLVWPL